MAAGIVYIVWNWQWITEVYCHYFLPQITLTELEAITHYFLKSNSTSIQNKMLQFKGLYIYYIMINLLVSPTKIHFSNICYSSTEEFEKSICTAFITNQFDLVWRATDSCPCIWIGHLWEWCGERLWSDTRPNNSWEVGYGVIHVPISYSLSCHTGTLMEIVCLPLNAYAI